MVNTEVRRERERWGARTARGGFLGEIRMKGQAVKAGREGALAALDTSSL
jgi:hypothetical protein